MNITKLWVEWYIGWANSPRIHATVEGLPKPHEFRYRVIDNIYWAEKDGIVSFFAWRPPHNNGGYSGAAFPITMEWGERVTLLGPWSSGPYHVNRLFPHSVDAVINGGHGHYFLKTALDEILLEHLPEVELTRGMDFSWVPTLRGMSVEESKAFIKERSHAA